MPFFLESLGLTFEPESFLDGWHSFTNPHKPTSDSGNRSGSENNKTTRTTKKDPKKASHPSAEEDDDDDATAALTALPLLPPRGSSVLHDPRWVPHLVKVWDVRVLPVSHRLVQGRMVPTVWPRAAQALWQAEQRLTLEVHGRHFHNLNQNQKKSKKTSRRKQPVRQPFFKPKSNKHFCGGDESDVLNEDFRRGLLQGQPQFRQPLEGRNEQLQAHDVVVVRFLKHQPPTLLTHRSASNPRGGGGGGSRAGLSRSLSTSRGAGVVHIIPSDEISSLGARPPPTEDDDEFHPLAVYPLTHLQVLSQWGQQCEVQLENPHTGDAVIRGVKFNRERDAYAFVLTVERMKALQQAQRELYGDDYDYDEEEYNENQLVHAENKRTAVTTARGLPRTSIVTATSTNKQPKTPKAKHQAKR